MRTMFRNFGFCCLATLSIGSSYANAQTGFVNGATGSAGNSLQLFRGEGKSLPLPGRVWVETNLGDGLGYQGSYFTLGGKTHLADDFLDGRWLLETQGHVSMESGGLFANIGLERVFSLKKAGADITLGGWIDYDGDEAGSFAHPFWQGAFNASIKTDRWDVVANGYIPFGDTVYTQGSLNGVSFFENGIALQAGLDTALRGYDVTFRNRPTQFANYNGSVDFGAYGYESEAVSYFTGVRARTGIQLKNGWRVSGEINRDDMFEWTGVLQLAYVWGANDRGTYSGLGNDLDPTMRNDHIVRFKQELVLAVDPDTGAAYNVLHVDNSAGAGGTGAFESRFASLADAEAVSSPDDIIFVYEGDGTTTGYDTGFVMQDRQFLLGDGIQHIVPLFGGGAVQLPNDVDGNLPTITNLAGSAITIDGSDTIIRGFNIDGSAPGTFMTHGIFANGLVNPIANARIEDVNVNGAVLDGIHLENMTGNADLIRITAQNNGRDGINLTNFGNSDTDIVLRDINASNNGRDGIHFDGYDAATVAFQGSIAASANLRHGINLEDFANSSGLGAGYLFQAPTLTGNVSDGLRISNADGNFAIRDAIMSNNGRNGVSLINVRNTNPLHQTLITSSASTISQYTLNSGAGIFVDLNDPGATQRLLVEFSQVDQNINGLQITASGLGTSLTTDIINNFSVSNNLKDGIFLRSILGAVHTATVTNTLLGLNQLDGSSRLNMNGNGAAAGNGFSLFAGDLFSADAATLTANISNVSLQNISGSGIFAATGNLGILNANLDDIIVTNATQGFAFELTATDPALISRINLTNSTVTASGAIGLLVNNGAGSQVDFLGDNLVFQNDAAAQLGAAGVLFSNNGLMRTSFTNNTIDGFDNFGFVAQSGGFAGRLLANVQGNTVTNSGPLNVLNGLGDLPHEDGMRIFINGGTGNVRMVNNVSSGHAQQGLNLTTAGTGQLNVLLEGNVITGNDLGDDPLNPAELLTRDLLVTNGFAAGTCLAMSNNVFSLDATVVNNSGAPSFVLELDGLTNGAGVPTIIGAVTNQPFGSTCLPAIVAEEAAFNLLGF